MTKVTNNYRGPLSVGGTEIPAGKSAEIENWDEVKKNSVVTQWLDADVITVGDKALEDMTKAEMVAFAKANDIEIDENAKKADIFDAIVEAQAEPQGA